MEEFAFKSQAANYEAMRPMYEAFSINLPRTTGIIQWMLNASWPKLYWQLYEYDLMPGGAFFGAKKGAAPLAIAYNYGDQGIYLVNQSERSLGNFQTTVTVRDLNSVKILEQTLTNAGPVFSSTKISDLASIASPTPVYFVELSTQSLSEPGDPRGKFLLALNQAGCFGREQDRVVCHAEQVLSQILPR